MLPFLKGKDRNLKPEEFAQEWLGLRNKYADPTIESAKTKQGLIVSAASVLDRIWNGGAGGAEDEGLQNDYLAPLRSVLIDREVFSRSECDLLNKHLDEILAVTRKNALRVAAAGEEETTLLSAAQNVDHVVKCVVVWCRHFPKPIPVGDEEEYHGHF